MHKKKTIFYLILYNIKFCREATSQEKGVTCAELSKRAMIRYSAYLYYTNVYRRIEIDENKHKYYGL